METAPSQTTPESSLLVGRFRPLPHVVWTTHADAAVLLDADRGLYYTLNSVAARVWELLAAGEPLAASLQSLEDEYEIDRQVLEADVATLLQSLLELALMEVRRP